MDVCIYQKVLPFELSVRPEASLSKHFPLVLGLNVMGASLLWKGDGGEKWLNPHQICCLLVSLLLFYF